MLNVTSEINKLKVPIITYHSIDDSGSVVSTAPRVFQRQMRQLSEEGYAAIALRDLVHLLKSRAKIPEKTVVCTFDDGFRNFYTQAYPVLEQYGFRATVFLVTDMCGKYNDWAGNPRELPRSELLSWEEVRKLDAFGIEFGSHTKTHPDLTQLPDEAAQLEVVGSKDAIEDKLGRETSTFAYPFGKNGPRLRRIVAAHYEAACSTNLGKVTEQRDLLSLDRLDAYYLSNSFVFGKLASPNFDRYMRIRRSMRTLRSIVGRA